ncbi:hypothetical protein MettiDRAFT_2790 [Methanolobus tindarius DSM 2278]|uniref:Uncharacterized protein n=1 Tax=Methanolobus tindarius DSM 2278 TaxID=1090322 RepID=W9DRB6_METTI|nr:hypothetical protein MettiDRAFT_2790 [Methanolobus tindarius DSM 2278]
MAMDRISSTDKIVCLFLMIVVIPYLISDIYDKIYIVLINAH